MGALGATAVFLLNLHEWIHQKDEALPGAGSSSAKQPVPVERMETLPPFPGPVEKSLAQKSLRWIGRQSVFVDQQKTRLLNLEGLDGIDDFVQVGALPVGERLE